MSKVFIVNEPLTKDKETGQWVSTMNLTPAEEFGVLTFLLPPGRLPADFSFIVERLMHELAAYTRDDYVLPVGDMCTAAMSVHIAMRATGGYVRLLRWNRRLTKYSPLEIDLTGNPLLAWGEFELGGFRHEPGAYLLQKVGELPAIGSLEGGF